MADDILGAFFSEISSVQTDPKADSDVNNEVKQAPESKKRKAAENGVIEGLVSKQPKKVKPQVVAAAPVVKNPAAVANGGPAPRGLPVAPPPKLGQHTAQAVLPRAPPPTLGAHQIPPPQPSQHYAPAPYPQGGGAIVPPPLQGGPGSAAAAGGPPPLPPPPPPPGYRPAPGPPPPPPPPGMMMMGQRGISNAPAWMASLPPGQLQPPPPAHPPPGQIKGKKRKDLKNVRAGAGGVWVDDTLDEWPEGDFRLFCGDLANDCTDTVLANAFKKYPSFAKAKIVREKWNKKSKGYGFVSFLDPFDCMKALREMDGKYVGNRPVKLKKSKWQERNLKEVKKKDKKKKKFEKQLGLA